jgi:hypothetical protein
MKSVSAIRSRGLRGNPFTEANGDFGITFDHDIQMSNEIILNLTTKYTSTLNISAWAITKNKDILIDLQVSENPNNVLLWVEHMHVDCFVESEWTFVDDWIQDTMDDSYHGTDSPGFFINDTFSYSETFSVQGRTPELMYYYDYYYEYFDFSYTGNTLFSEENLRKAGRCYGVSFYVVYDVVLRGQNEPSDRITKFVIEDNFIVNVKDGNMVDNTGDKADVPASEPVPGFELIGGIITLISVPIVLKIRQVWKRKL